MCPKLLSLICALAISCTSLGQVKVTYLANEGVMVEGGGTKVLMDPFFKVGFGLYQVLPMDIDALATSHPELGNADVILVSHRHMDHINPGMVAAYMGKNRATILLSSSQASDSVVNLFGIEKKRIINLLPKMNEEILSTRVQGIEFKAAWMRHGNERNFDVVNLCFVTSIGNRKIMHLGDSEVNPLSFRQVDFSGEAIDLLLAPSWWLIEEYGGPAIIRERIKPKKIIAFHLSKDYEKYKENILRSFPDVIFFDTSFSTFRLD